MVAIIRHIKHTRNKSVGYGATYRAGGDTQPPVCVVAGEERPVETEDEPDSLAAPRFGEVPCELDQRRGRSSAGAG